MGKTRESKAEKLDMKEVFTPVLNSLVFIQEENSREVPDVDGIGAVWRTDSMVAASCLPDCDGDTRLVLLEKENAPDGLVSVFDDNIMTPSGWITVTTLPDNLIFRTSAPGPSTRVRIWTNGHMGSDVVVMRFGD